MMPIWKLTTKGQEAVHLRGYLTRHELPDGTAIYVRDTQAYRWQDGSVESLSPREAVLAVYAARGQR